MGTELVLKARAGCPRQQRAVTGWSEPSVGAAGRGSPFLTTQVNFHLWPLCRARRWFTRPGAGSGARLGAGQGLRGARGPGSRSACAWRRSVRKQPPSRYLHTSSLSSCRVSGQRPQPCPHPLFVLGHCPVTVQAPPLCSSFPLFPPSPARRGAPGLPGGGGAAP